MEEAAQLDKVWPGPDLSPAHGHKEHVHQLSPKVLHSQWSFAHDLQEHVHQSSPKVLRLEPGRHSHRLLEVQVEPQVALAEKSPPSPWKKLTASSTAGGASGGSGRNESSM